MYLCNRLALCRCDREKCGNTCILTKDKNYRVEPIEGQKIVVNNLRELNFYTDALRQTEIDFKVEGFTIYFLKPL